MNIDHLDALGLLENAIDYCKEFLEFIDNCNDGDHPSRDNLEKFLEYYESLK
jgi:hypothetical protein